MSDVRPLAQGPLAHPLAHRYAGIICDLDGVVRLGTQPVAHAVEQLSALSIPVVYATNNASLTPQDVAGQLVGLGLQVGADRVVTSSQAGAEHIARTVPPGSPVLAVGGPGVAAALAEVGLAPVRVAGPGVVCVLQGYGPQVTAADLAEAAYAVEGGATWVATNRDATLPTNRGIAPGNGALLAAVALATGVEPVAVGKPEPALYELSVHRLGVAPSDVLVVGDRLDTDILGAMAAGLDSLWVLTGVDDLVAFARAPGRPVPTMVATDLRALAGPPLQAVVDGDDWVCGCVRLAVDWTSGRVEATGVAADDVRGANALATVAVAALAQARDEMALPVDVLIAVAARIGDRVRQAAVVGAAQ